MPYDYRKLTQEARNKIVQHRSEQGYPLHAPPHPFREAGYYLISAAIFEHKPVILDPGRRSAFETNLITEMNEIHAEVISWVILPNHYHILVDVADLNLISSALMHLHGTTSRQWNLEDEITGKRKVWYKFSDRIMRNKKQLHSTFNYIHYNPVKHGYVDVMYDWQWSSMKMYTDSKGKDWLQERWISDPPGKDMGKGWDD
jgi:putative transposase